MSLKQELVERAEALGIEVSPFATRAELERAIAEAAESGPDVEPHKGFEDEPEPEPEVDDAARFQRNRTRTWRHRVDGRERTVTTGSRADRRYAQFEEWEPVG